MKNQNQASVRGRVLMLNWRDPWHPAAGGAEVVTLRVLERLAARGWDVEWFSSSYPGAHAEESRDGIRYVRRGNSCTVHAQAFVNYRHCRNFDIVIDQINTLPFFASVYSKAPVVGFIHQLAREVWFYEARPPLSHLGYFLEPMYLSPYKNVPIITVSDSTRESLIELGFKGRIYVIPEAVDEPCDETVPSKSSHQDIIVLGRVTPSKRIEHSIEAAYLMACSGWRGTMHIVGAGSQAYHARLARKVSALGLGEHVLFHGRISAPARSEILRRSSLLWMTSVREGWGLVVTEAARHGTPAVAYNVPGLRDAVKPGLTGELVDQTPAALAAASIKVISKHEDYCSAALRDARRFNWPATTDEFENAMVRELAR